MAIRQIVSRSILLKMVRFTDDDVNILISVVVLVFSRREWFNW